MIKTAALFLKNKEGKKGKKKKKKKRFSYRPYLNNFSMLPETQIFFFFGLKMINAICINRNRQPWVGKLCS